MDSDGYTSGPTRSSLVITNHSDTQFGQRTVADESYVKPFSLSDINRAVKSTTDMDEDDDRALGQTGQAPDPERRVNPSDPNLNADSDHKQGPTRSETAMNKINKSKGDGSAKAFNLQAPGMSMNGKNFKKQNDLMMGLIKQAGSN